MFWKIEQKRGQALAAFATSKGLRYKERDDSVVSRFTKLGDRSTVASTARPHV